MTVDKEKLISAVVEQTGMEPGYVDQQFEELIAQIRQAKAQHDAVDIERLGTFTVVEERLEFSPCELLQTEINSKYVGMKPIELIEAFKEPAGHDAPVAEVPEEEPPQDQEPEATEEAPVVLPEETVETPEEPVVAEEKPVAEEEVQTPPDPEEVRADEPDKTDTKTKPEPASVQTIKTSAKKEESLKTDPLGKAVVIIVVILTLAIAGWLAYDLGLFGTGEAAQPSAPPSEPPVEQQTEAGQQSASSASGPLIGQKSQKSNAIAVEAASSPPKEQGNDSGPLSVESKKYGLYGGFNKEVNAEFFTIVVHSLRTMKLAKQKKQTLVDEGFRTKIKEVRVNGRTYFRVGIGQFPTVKVALQAVEELPEPYHSNNFVNRF